MTAFLASLFGGFTQRRPHPARRPASYRPSIDHLEERSLLSVSPLTVPTAPAGTKADVQNLEKVVDSFQTQVDALVTRISTDIVSKNDIHSEVTQLATLTQTLRNRVNLRVTNILGDDSNLGTALTKGLAHINGLGNQMNNRAINLTTDIHWDLNHSLDATSDVSEVGETVDNFDAQVHAILQSYLGIYDTHPPQTSSSSTLTGTPSAMPSTVPTPPGAAKAQVQKLEQAVDNLQGQVDALVAKITTAITNQQNIKPDVTQLDTLAQELRNRINLRVTNILAQFGLGSAVVADLAHINGLGNQMNSRATDMTTDIHWDLNNKVDPTSDVAQLGEAVDHLDTQVHAILHSYLGIYDTHG